jgi:hypothetical protein
MIQSHVYYMRVIREMILVLVSRFFQKLTKMNFAENKNMRSICSLHRPLCYYVGGYMRGKKKNKKLLLNLQCTAAL